MKAWPIQSNKGMRSHGQTNSGSGGSLSRWRMLSAFDFWFLFHLQICRFRIGTSTSEVFPILPVRRKNLSRSGLIQQINTLLWGFYCGWSFGLVIAGWRLLTDGLPVLQSCNIHDGNNLSYLHLQENIEAAGWFIAKWQYEAEFNIPEDWDGVTWYFSDTTHCTTQRAMWENEGRQISIRNQSFNLLS